VDFYEQARAELEAEVGMRCSQRCRSLGSDIKSVAVARYL